MATGRRTTYRPLRGGALVAAIGVAVLALGVTVFLQGSRGLGVGLALGSVPFLAWAGKYFLAAWEQTTA